MHCRLQLGKPFRLETRQQRMLHYICAESLHTYVVLAAESRSGLFWTSIGTMNIKWLSEEFPTRLQPHACSSLNTVVRNIVQIVQDCYRLPEQINM